MAKANRVVEFDDVDGVLVTLSTRAAKKATVEANRAALPILFRAMRAAINASSASPALKREARRTIGVALKSKRKRGAGDAGAKGGFAVGKSQEKSPARKKSGVGIGTNNVHWPVLGTKKRRTRGGKATGQMPRLLDDVMATAFAACKDQMLAAAKQAMSAEIHRAAVAAAKRAKKAAT